VNEITYAPLLGPYSVEDEGYLFRVAALPDTISGAPMGVLAHIAWAATNPVIKRVESGEFVFHFIINSPYSKPPEYDGVTYFSMTLYATVPHDHPIGPILQTAIRDRTIPEELTQFAERLLRQGFNVACNFIDVLRHSFDQFWLCRPNNLLSWSSITYCSRPDNKAFAMPVGDNFTSELLRQKWDAESDKTFQPKIVLKHLSQTDLEQLDHAKEATAQTFADEMVSTALVEVRLNRFRSSVLHAMIAIEAVAKRSLEMLLTTKLEGLPAAKVIDSVSREVSTLTLAKVVMNTFYPNGEPSAIDWTKLESLHTLRNQIVHCGQRKMPPYKDLRDRVLEARSFVRQMENSLGCDQIEPPTSTSS